MPNLTCIECPLGCTIEVVLDGDNVASVSGNTCPRGKLYAENEVTCPKRVVTTTVKTSDGRLVSVRTDTPVPKSKVFEVVKRISAITIDTPVNIYDIILKDILDGVNVVATDDLK